MSSIHIPRVLAARGKTAVDLDRENFEKAQTTSIQKAVNAQESAVKEKHARIIIIGSHQEKSGTLFWSIVRRQPLQDSPIVAWKFCHVLHKLLRDGHAQCLPDSQRHVRFLTDLGRLWGHLREGYGQLITHYVKLINQKLAFHAKNVHIPGNLLMSDERLEKMCNNDINTYFELSVDMLDYMDDVLNLQNVVFNSLDMLRSNSMTSSGQCRLAPLTLCVQDSCQLYDFLVKLLFRLHSSISPDTLTGHRDRFYKQFQNLKLFYSNVRKLQYFRNLITVPVLPDSAPNFLQANELSRHVKPVVIMPEPEPEPSEDNLSESDHQESVVDMLIDTSVTQAAQASAAQEELLNAQSAQMAESDKLIRQLQWEVNQLKHELMRMKAEDQMVIESLNNRVKDLEMDLNELRQIAESTTQENEMLKNMLKDGEKQAEATAHLANIEKISKGHEEKYKKMKDIYAKLREEHVQVLRTQAELTKQYNTEKRAREDIELKHKAVSEAVNDIQREKATLEASLMNGSAATNERLDAVTEERDKLQREYQEMEMRLRRVTEDKTTLEQTVAGHQIIVDKLQRDFEAAASSRSTAEQQLQQRASDREQLQQQMSSLSAEREGLSDRLTAKTRELEDTVKELQAIRLDKASLEAAQVSAQRSLDETQQRVDELTADRERSQRDISDKDALIAQLRAQINTLIAERTELEQRLNAQLLDNRRRMLVSAVTECEFMINSSLAEADNPHHSTTTSTAEYLLDKTKPLLDSLQLFNQSCSTYQQDQNEVSELVKSLVNFTHRLADTVVCGFATAHAAQIEPGEELVSRCRSCGEQTLKLFSLIKNESYADQPSQSSRVNEAIQSVMTLAGELLPKVEDVEAEKLGDLVDEEMRQTSEAIEAAAAKIAEMLANSRRTDSGIKLEVNGKILDSCNSLMMAIKVLIEKSKALQREIVSQGRGTASVKEFYKKHHRWTEGLISAAKAVGWGANVLVESADKAVKGEGRWEELVVVSQEIAASTTQLVVASKVKAERGSDNLHQLSDASKGVTNATGKVVASAKSAAQLSDDIDTMDFSKMTLHQAKKQEMESQIHVLQLEQQLDKERQKLSELRKTHYKLAGESEGWDQEEIYGEDSCAFIVVNKEQEEEMLDHGVTTTNDCQEEGWA